MQTIAVFALKGGVGKSAVTVFLADFLSSVFGKQVLVIDLDPQQSASVAILGEERWQTAVAKGASVGKMLLDYLRGDHHAFNVVSYVSMRPDAKGRGSILRAVSVLASDREAWHDLNDRMSAVAPAHQSRALGSLRSLLRAVAGQFDVCLMDFPASQTGPITQCGLAAADWWLLPVEPNRMGLRDFDGPRGTGKSGEKSAGSPRDWGRSSAAVRIVPATSTSERKTCSAISRRRSEFRAPLAEMPRSAFGSMR